MCSGLHLVELKNIVYLIVALGTNHPIYILCILVNKPSLLQI